MNRWCVCLLLLCNISSSCDCCDYLVRDYDDDNDDDDNGNGVHEVYGRRSHIVAGLVYILFE